jgi:hypothetical protein
MRKGAIAMLDALGFKGVWKRRGIDDQHELVLEKLRRVQASLVQNTAFMNAFAQQLKPRREAKIESCLVSDTVVIGVSAVTEEFRDDPRNAMFLTCVAALASASAIQLGVALPEPTLAYRGCIAFGRFEMDGAFYVGPAVDEAAESMEKANGPFVWLGPSALEAVGGPANAGLCEALIEWSVPLNGGATYDTLCVRTLPPITREWLDRLFGSFPSAPLELAVKRQNAEKFYRHIVQAGPIWEKNRGEA